MQGRVLIIAGSDSGGGAGIQADIKTVTALGGYGATAITALTAQNTTGVHAVHEVPEDFVAKQISVVLNDIGADCIKIGMLHRSEIINTVAAELEKFSSSTHLVIPLVLDPVMIAKGGHSLLADDALGALRSRLLPLAGVLTPNVPEAEALSGISITNTDDMANAANALLEMGPGAVLVKGGHMQGETITDLLVVRGRGPVIFTRPRIKTTSTHGTGCTTASAIAVGMAQGMDLPSAVKRAGDYVARAIETAPGYGHGHGPLNHGHTFSDF